MKFRGAVIYTNNVQKMVDFYELISGEKGEDDLGHMGFDSLQLAIYNPGEVKVGKDKNITLMYSVEYVEALYKKKLESMYSGLILNNPTKKSWGVTSFQVQDPEGNELSFLS